MSNSMKAIRKIYSELYKFYGPQGWWPLLELNNSVKINITKSGSLEGYHPNDYSYPKTNEQTFQICLGAILTQNTSWMQVEKALKNLKKQNALTLSGLNSISEETLKEAIKPAGYFNQKAKKIRNFTQFFKSLNGKTPSRQELLSIWGVGEETADSMLLYGFKIPTFIVDSYTKRVFGGLGLIENNAPYSEIKAIFEGNLDEDLIVFQEYHALIAEHAKRFYSKKPYGKDDPLKQVL